MPPTPTSTPTPRPQAQLKSAAALYAGPGDFGYDTVAQLAKDAKVTPLGVYGDFVQAQAEVSGTVKSGFLPANLLDPLPANLPTIPKDQVPWRIARDYVGGNSLTYSNSGDGWTSQWLDRDIVLQGPFKLQIQLEGQGRSNYVALYGREPQGGDWWQGISRIVVGLDWGSAVFINLFDGTSQDPCYNQGFPKPADGRIVIESDEKGKHIVIRTSNNEAVKTIDVSQFGNFANGVFPNGITHAELSSGPQSQMAVTQLFLLIQPDGKIGATSPAQPTPTPSIPNRTAYRQTAQYACQGIVQSDAAFTLGTLTPYSKYFRLGAKVVNVDYATETLTVDVGGGKTIQVHPDKAAGGHLSMVQYDDSSCGTYSVVGATIYDFQAGDAVAVIGGNEQALRGNVPEVVQVIEIAGMQ